MLVGESTYLNIQLYFFLLYPSFIQEVEPWYSCFIVLLRTSFQMKGRLPNYVNMQQEILSGYQRYLLFYLTRLLVSVYKRE